MNSLYKTPLFNVYSGCSFSEHFCWPSFLDSDKTIDVHNEDPIFVREDGTTTSYYQFDESYVDKYYPNRFHGKSYNLAMSSGGNDLVTYRVIGQVNKLLKKHKPENIRVGIMWTGWERKAVYIDKSNLYFNEVQPSKEEIKNIYIDPPFIDFTLAHSYMNPSVINEDHHESGGDVKKTHWKKLKDAEHMYFLVGGDARARDYIDNEATFEKWPQLYYDRVHHHSTSYYDYLKNILFVQNYLESKNIKYFMTVWQCNDISTHSDYNDKGDFAPHVYPLQFGVHNEEIPDMNNYPRYVDCFPYSQHLYDEINWDKFIFWENDLVPRAGLGEFTRLQNLGFTEDNFHPSENANYEWSKFLKTKLKGFWDE